MPPAHKLNHTQTMLQDLLDGLRILRRAGIAMQGMHGAVVLEASSC